MIWRLIKTLVFLSILAGVGLVIYAYLGPILTPGEFTPPSTQTRVPVIIELGE